MRRWGDKAIWALCLVITLFFGSGNAVAGPLAERLASFPNWESKPLVHSAAGDLVYPDWMAGTWQVRSTLVDLVAPLAPNVVTPGFEGNRRYLNQPITFQVRFAQARLSLPSLKFVPRPIQRAVVADRAFNGLNLAKAYLGDRAVLAVMVDPSSPNRQITLLRDNRQLISVVTGRATETPAAGQFITTEVFQQLFRGSGIARPQARTASGASPYFNQVETTTSYRQLLTSHPAIELAQSSSRRTLRSQSRGRVSQASLLNGGGQSHGRVPQLGRTVRRNLRTRLARLEEPLRCGGSPRCSKWRRTGVLTFEADQVTAVYLSPQDPSYFAAGSRPVALYRYRLEFFKGLEENTPAA
ncbi:MAG: hypothetical protein JO235_24285 [Chroococcidiopsidaceae cyanobacterium CP_BM_RX_35]|nr:hypothetical protein [Chroococcidiopsidaceae cyanobacterium CP_BM_RX_35]